MWFFSCNVLRRRGNPRRGFPLFSAKLKIHPFLRFFAHGGISPSADGDQGLFPWNPLPFLQRSKRKRKEAKAPCGACPPVTTAQSNPHRQIIRRPNGAGQLPHALRVPDLVHGHAPLFQRLVQVIVGHIANRSNDGVTRNVVDGVGVRLFVVDRPTTSPFLTSSTFVLAYWVTPKRRRSFSRGQAQPKSKSAAILLPCHQGHVPAGGVQEVVNLLLGLCQLGHHKEQLFRRQRAFLG